MELVQLGYVQTVIIVHASDLPAGLLRTDALTDSEEGRQLDAWVELEPKWITYSEGRTSIRRSELSSFISQ